MTTIQKTLQGRAQVRRQGLRAVWQTMLGWANRRHQRQTLARLDGHMLRDIAMPHDVAMRECEKPFWKA